MTEFRCDGYEKLSWNVLNICWCQPNFKKKKNSIEENVLNLKSSTTDKNVMIYMRPF